MDNTIFEKTITKDNVMDAISIFHTLPMKEKSFIQLNAKTLIDKPCKIKKNCQEIELISRFLPKDLIIECNDECDYDELVAGRISKIVDSYVDLNIKERERKMRSNFKEPNGFIKISHIIFDEFIYGTSVPHLFFALMEIANDFRKYNDPVGENFIMTELIPFKFEDYDIYHNLNREDKTLYLSAIWESAIKSDANPDQLVYIYKTLNDLFEFRNVIARNQFFSFFNINSDDIEDEVVLHEVNVQDEDLVGDKSKPKNVENIDIESLENAVKRVLKCDNIEISFDIDENDLCILKEDFHLELKGKYVTISNTGLHYVVKCISEGKEFVLFKIKNSTQNVFGVSSDGILMIMKLTDNKFFFTEF